MCKISKQLKLSNYKEGEVQERDIWAYYRLGAKKDEDELGLNLWMHQLKPEIDQNHKRIICRMLNKSSCFDFEVTPQEGDILQIIFGLNESLMAFYYFIFSNKKWKTIYISTRDVRRERDVLFKGKIQKGLTSSIKKSDFIHSD